MALLCCLALPLGACGDDAGTKGTGRAAGVALDGATWDGGPGVDPTQPSDKVRVIAFFKPG